MAENEFVKAQSDNLPNVDSFMLMEFIRSNDCFNAAEIRGVKAQSSMRSNYVDNAVGYVQLKREGSKCIVKCEMCPEHKVKAKNYKVLMIVDEDNEVIETVKCVDCAASEGGCKHALAFLMWVHEKSTQPAPTAVECYWKKPKLARVGSTIPFITTASFGEVKKIQHHGAVDDFFQDFLTEGRQAGASCQLLKCFEDSDQAQAISSLGLHELLHSFHLSGKSSYNDFLCYAKRKMTDELCKKVAQETKGQSSCDVWFELRYGRLTASKVYSAAHTKKPDGTFVNTVIGAHKTVQTKAMKRGLLLEAAVLKVLEKRIGKKIQRCGLVLNKNYPEIGASPDGYFDNCVVEVKCPSSEKTFNQYILKSTQISAKYNAQIQVQMFLMDCKKGLFCVADPNFENNNIINVLEIDYDESFVEDILGRAREFWRNVIFNRLLNTVI